jgi:hypothetical protein
MVVLGLVVLSGSSAVAAADGPAGIGVAVKALERAWAMDPRTRGTPLPPMSVVPEGRRPQQACPEAPLAAPEALALFCPVQNRVLLDPRLAVLAQRNGVWDAAVWIGSALGQAILSASGPPRTGLGVVAPPLQAFCFAGTLLGQAPALTPPAGGKALSAARSAYPSRLNGSQGSAAQRAYALLTGLGGTASDCADAAMARLAAGAPPDPDLLRLLATNPDRSTGDGAMEDVLNALCLPKPPLGCPRRLPPARERSTLR